VPTSTTREGPPCAGAVRRVGASVDPEGLATGTPPPAGLPGLSAVLDRARSENFTVASRALPGAVRDDLMAVYGFARLVDEIGDAFSGDRRAALDWVGDELRRAVAGTASHPLLERVGSTVRRRSLPLEPFEALIEANRRDQDVTTYETFDDLVGYCALSANPIGRIVLGVLGCATPQRSAWSDDVCTALQVVEHLQDLAEDVAGGRCYLPLEDVAASGGSLARIRSDVQAGWASGPTRAVVALEVGRADALLRSGGPLSATLPWRFAVAVGGFTAGGMAAVDAIRAVHHDVIAYRCRPARTRVAAHLVALLRPRYGAQWR